ncbi:MAG: TIR domain-containing protein [bacterium]|nr:TIR domain-containing protein [bacterium]
MTTFHLDPGGLADADALSAPIERLWHTAGRSGLLDLLQELAGGLTDTRVVLARATLSTADLQPHHLVFKVGPTKVIRDELERYDKLKEHFRTPAVFAELLEPEATRKALSSAHLLGALAYQFAADQLAGDNLESLKESFAGALRGEAPAAVRTVLDATLRALGTLYSRPSQEFGFRIRSYYLDRWFPDAHLRVETRHPFGKSGSLLTLERNNAQAFRASMPNPRTLRAAAQQPYGPEQREVEITGLHKVHLWGDVLQLRAAASDPLRLRIDVGQLSAEDRETIEGTREVAVWAPGSDFRGEQYRERLKSAFPGLPLDVPAFRVGNLKVPNPLLDLAGPLDTLVRQPISVAPAHGDLHPGNVLVVGQTPLVIDFGLADPELPLGVDPVRLFGCLVRDVVSDVLDDRALPLVLPVALDLIEDGSRGTGPERTARELLTTLWQGTRKLVGEADAEHLAAHLYGFAWIGLKWDGPPEAWRACFLMACLAARQLLGEPEEDGPPLRPGSGLANGGVSSSRVYVDLREQSRTASDRSSVIESEADSLETLWSETPGPEPSPEPDRPSHFDGQLEVFLCHSPKAWEQAKELYRRLQADGVRPWLESEDLLGGQTREDEIQKRVRECDVVVVLLGNAFHRQAGLEQQIIKWALEVHGKQPPGSIFLIPALVEECEVPDNFRDLAPVRLFEEGGYEKLKRSLEARRDQLRSMSG